MPSWPSSPTASCRRWFIVAKRAVRQPAFAITVAFFTFGVINNLLYVIVLSAALDLVGFSTPKGVVLVADVLPSFIVKLLAPCFIDAVSYDFRVLSFAVLSAGGMLLVALTPESRNGVSILFKLLGVACASLSSGGGELSFLGLTHFYGQSSLAAWSSGTGAAGLLGSGIYALATISLGVTPRNTILASALAPGFMLWAYFGIIPRATNADTLGKGYTNVSQDVPADETEPDEGDYSGRDLHPDGEFARGGRSVSMDAFKANHQSLKEKLTRARKLIVPFMIPLFLVFLAEYSINQGVAPTLLFPPQRSPFRTLRDFYLAYMAIYQVGVFISRSSTPFVRIRRLYPPSIFQLVNLVILTAQALFGFLPNVWFIFVIIAWEGLLGGGVYVNTYAQILDTVDDQEREFSLSATAFSDSFGILLASLVSIALETWLCNWQIGDGRSYCREV